MGDSLEPSPAQLGDTTTLAPGEWTPLDDIGTQIYVYGDQPVDVAVQYAEVESEIRQLRFEVERRARNEARLVNAFESLTQDTDGGEVDGDAEIPVGEIRRLFHEAIEGTRP